MAHNVAGVVLDASALLALILSEPGANVVIAAGADFHMSAVNFSEVLYKVAERGSKPRHVELLMDKLKITVHAFDTDDAFSAAALKSKTDVKGLSFGDRACIALALRLKTPVLTADRAWTSVDTGADVRLIR